MGARLEVGKNYQCGDVVVKVIHIEEITTKGGLMYSGVCYGSTAFAKVVDSEGDVVFRSAVGTFDPRDGEYSCDNCSDLKYFLKEIEAAKEMTMEQVNKALGFEAKIVEG